MSFAVLLGAVASAQDAGEQSESVEVVVSIQPWASIVQQIGGERVVVSVLLPAGASPHTFEPLPSQVVAIASADLIVMNGGVDAWLERMVTAVANGSPTLRLLDHASFEPIQLIGHDHEHADEEEDADHADHAAGSSETSVTANPHIWLDPTIVSTALSALVAKLSVIDPAGSEQYTRNAETLATDLVRLDSEVASALAEFRDWPLVPLHDAWAYFARRYGLTVAATIEPFAGREPSARYLVETVGVIRESGAQVIFNERQLNDRTARVIAESAGVRLATLDPLGGEPGPERYQDLITANAKAIAGAFGQ